MIYYSIVLLVVILYVLFKGHEKTYMIIVAVILTLFAGLRADTIGADTLTYSWIFEKVGYEGLKDTGFFFLHRDRAATMHEPGFDVIAYAITYIGDFLYLKLFCAAIVIVPACIYIYKN